LGVFASVVRAQGAPCCSITAINAHNGTVSANVNSTGAPFLFKVTDGSGLSRFRVGQGVYANFSTNQVSLDGKNPCCTIISRSQTPVTPQPRPIPPSSARGSAVSQSASSTSGNPASAVQALSKHVATPVNVRTTNSLDDCRSHSNGNGIGCAAAMGNGWYLLIWEWTGRDTDIDGFNVYQGGTPSISLREPIAQFTGSSSAISSVREPATQFAGGNNAASSVRSPVAQLAQKPIEINSQHPLQRLAVLDPKRVGTDVCFSVTAYSGTTESSRSQLACVTAASAATPLFKSIALVPAYELAFFGYHDERTNHVYCSNNYGHSSFPSGTGVWTLMWNLSKTPPYPTDYGVVMSLAQWDAGHDPFPCQELFTQVLRLGVTFEFPPDLARVQSATLVTNLQSVEIGGVTLSELNSSNGYIPCVWAVYSLQTSVGGNETHNLPLTTFDYARPFDWSIWYPGLIGGAPSRWIYPATDGIPGNVLPAVGIFQWPPTNGVYRADVTAAAQQHSDGVALMMKTEDDQIGWPNVIQPVYTEDHTYYDHQNKAVCQYKFSNIRLQLNYIAKTGS
jgi:hypothetical protein